METTIDTIEYNGEDVDVMITWDVIQCECTSDYGNSSVTERWEEAEALEARLMKDGITQIIHYFSDRSHPVFIDRTFKKVSQFFY